MPETVRVTPIVTADRTLSVSTIKIGPNYYDTVVFDDSPDKRHSGSRVGNWVIDKTNVRTTTREGAMGFHRGAVLVARDEPIQPTP